MTDYTDCMSQELKGKLAGKTKAKREALFKAAAKKCSKDSKSKARSIPKPKSKPKERTRTITKKDAPKKRRRGPFEKKVDKSIIEWADFRRALRVPVNQSHFKFVGGTWRIRIGSIKIKRQRLVDAMKELRKRVRNRI